MTALVSAHTDDHPIPENRRSDDEVVLELRRGDGLRLLDVDAGVTDERARDDEENQQVENRVEHRCEVDARRAIAIQALLKRGSHGLRKLPLAAA